MVHNVAREVAALAHEVVQLSGDELEVGVGETIGVRLYVLEAFLGGWGQKISSAQ